MPAGDAYRHYAVKYVISAETLRIFQPKAQYSKRLGKSPADGFRVKFGIKFGTKFGIRGKRATRVAGLLELIASGAPVTAREFASNARLSDRTVEKDILLLRQLGLVERQGSRKTGSYVLTDQGRKVISDL